MEGTKTYKISLLLCMLLCKCPEHDILQLCYFLSFGVLGVFWWSGEKRHCVCSVSISIKNRTQFYVLKYFKRTFSM